MAPIKQPPSLLSRKKEEDTIIKKNNVSIEKGVGDILHSCNIDHVQLFIYLFFYKAKIIATWGQELSKDLCI